MAISARNVFAGTVSEIREGTVNAEVSLSVARQSGLIPRRDELWA